MTYDVIRPQIQTFDILLWWGEATLSKLIRTFTGGPSHVAMAVRDSINDVVSVWEATIKEAKSGVMLCGLSDELKGYKGRCVWRRVAMTAALRRQAEERLPAVREELEGRPFEKSHLEFIRAAYDGPFGENTRDTSSLFCSEAFAETWLQCGLLLPGQPSNEYSPRDFADNAKRPLALASGVVIHPGVEVETTVPETMKVKAALGREVKLKLWDAIQGQLAGAA